MKVKAKRDFNSISLKKTFKEGESINEDPKLVAEWIRQGMAIEVKENKKAPKRQTKELKSQKKTK